MSDSIRKFLDYDGLVLYTNLEHKWVLEQISHTSGITEERAKELIAEGFKEKVAAGKSDDVRVYSSYKAFPLIIISSYKPASGVAVAGVTYYVRTGSGTVADPYVYTVTTVNPGDPVTGLYVYTEDAPYHYYTSTWDPLSPPDDLPNNDVIFTDRSAQNCFVWKSLVDPAHPEYSGEYFMVYPYAYDEDVQGVFS